MINNLAKTYLMNSTKREYIYLGNYYPEYTEEYLLKLEKFASWNLRLDDIFIKHSFTNLGYLDVKDKIYIYS
jgi:hypothetical protein